MKICRLLYTLIIALSFCTVIYAEDEDSGIDNPHAYHLQEGMDLVSTTKVVYEKPKIIAKLVFPELTSDDESDEIADFNDAVNTLLKSEIDALKTKVTSLSSNELTSSKRKVRNNLTVDFDSSVLNLAKTPIISVRFVILDDRTGMAHPAHYHRVLNMSLDDSETLTLDDLFKPDSNYLFWISNYVTHTLEKQLKNTSLFADALTPTPEHFANWNLEPDGMRFTFDEATVAPYVYGTQSVTIPYDKLEPMLDPDSVLGECLQHQRRCLRNHLVTGGFMS